MGVNLSDQFEKESSSRMGPAPVWSGLGLGGVGSCPGHLGCILTQWEEVEMRWQPLFMSMVPPNKEACDTAEQREETRNEVPSES